MFCFFRMEHRPSNMAPFSIFRLGEYISPLTSASFVILTLLVARISPSTFPLHKTSFAAIFANTVAALSIRIDSATRFPEKFPTTWTIPGWFIFPFVSLFLGNSNPKVATWYFLRSFFSSPVQNFFPRFNLFMILSKFFRVSLS